MLFSGVTHRDQAFISFIIIENTEIASKYSANYRESKKGDRHLFLKKGNNLYSGYYPQKKKPVPLVSGYA